MEEKPQKTILLVEDEAVIGIASKRKLEGIGYRVLLASDGSQAIQQAEEHAEISLVLMDIDLGHGQNGIATCQDILRSRRIPIVFVSSHTEPEVVSLTEQVTSYGYIVKSSLITVYDACIKMAYKLFNEKNEKDRFANFLRAALDSAVEPLFISDLKGDIVFYNQAYLRLQGPSESREILRDFGEYSELINVFSSDGLRLAKDDWASTRGLRGLSGENAIYYVYSRRLGRIMANYYSYAPIRDDSGRIIGSYVKITGQVEKPDQGILARISLELGL